MASLLVVKSSKAAVTKLPVYMLVSPVSRHRLVAGRFVSQLPMLMASAAAVRKNTVVPRNLAATMDKRPVERCDT